MKLSEKIKLLWDRVKRAAKVIWTDLDKKKAAIIAGIIIALIIAAVAIISLAAGKNNGKKEDTVTETETVPEAEQETAPPTDIVAVSADGPQFPALDVEIPTTEPAPEYMTIGTESWFVADVQERLMELGFMDEDEPTTYYGEGTSSAVKIFQRQHELSQDGVLGPETLALLMSDDAKHYAAKEGDSGDDVIAIQQRLYQLGYLASEELVTGTFGEKTKEAVLSLQEHNGITVDGTVGRQTYDLIYSDEVKANLLSYGDKSDVVLQAQKRLLQLGYMTSTPDGTYGNDTVDATKTFQRKNSLVVDGYLGPETRAYLMSDQALPNHLGIGDEGDQVLRVQNQLVKLGYLSSSKATGYFGEITQKAVKNFQKQNGLTQDGQVGPATLTKLTSGKAKKAASGMIDGKNFDSTTTKSQTTKGSTTTGGTGTTAGSTTTGSGADAGSDQQAVTGSSVPNTDANGVSGSVANLLAVARSKIGCPYVWGSKGPNSFDCSGFVYWCLNQCGIGQSYITSSAWANVGKYTRISNYSDLRAGDIIVVKGHVGIISTGGYLIDASSSNGRVIERPLGSWWQSHFKVGWRIF